jgi:hypothetical protein
MRVSDAGPHITVAWNGIVSVLEPMMTRAAAAAMCEDFKAQVAHVKPPPPVTSVLHACKVRALDGVYRKCLGLP